MIFNDITLARAIHVLALVHWFGGVAAVTTIILPKARAMANPKDAIEAFEAFERPFAQQVRVSVFLVGLSGVYLLAKYDAWNRFQHVSFWWLHLMVLIWIAFATMVFVLEPLAVHRAFHDFALKQKEFAFRLAILLHTIALFVSALAIIAGVFGAHGGLP